MFALVLALCIGSPVLTLEDHDYVYPRLSPDGQRLLVARVKLRPDGSETTSVQIVDVGSGKSRELVSEALAQENEVYETYVTDLRWDGDGRIEVDLSDGDVGGTLLTIDALTGKVLDTKIEDEGDVVVPPEPLPQGMDVPAGFELLLTVERPGDIVFLLASETTVRLHSLRGRDVKLLAEWPLSLRNQCPRIDTAGGRLLLFVRPCTRSEPSSAELWQIADGRATQQDLGANVDELSLSADGKRAAVSRWRDGRRVVEIRDCETHVEAASPRIAVRKPAIIAFFPPVTEQTNDALDDFQWYAAHARRPLRDAGIDFHVVYATSFTIEVHEKPPAVFRPGPIGVGYYFVAPGKAPRIEYGVDTDEGIFHVAREYFGIDVVADREE